MGYLITEGYFAGKIEYGLAFCGAEERLEVPLLTACREDIEALAALLNELEVEPCHFEDVIEDYLTDFTV